MILVELKQRATERCEVIEFTVQQLRTKFKKCVSECKQAALTVKTAKGIKRFQEERGFRNQFNALFALVQSRHSYKPELALKPSSLEKELMRLAKMMAKKDCLFQLERGKKLKQMTSSVKWLLRNECCNRVT